jgi:uncharacterized protein (DUF885 family)
MPKLVPFLICTAVLAAPAAAAPAKGNPAVTRLHALFDQEWQRQLTEDPLFATGVGDHRYDDRWPDISPAAVEKSHQADLAVLAKLKAIARGALPESERLNYDLFQRSYQQRVEAWPFKPWLYEVNPGRQISAREGPQSLNETSEDMPFDTSAQYGLWLTRLERLPAYLDQVTARMRESVAEKRTQPRELMERVVPQLAMQLSVRPEDGPFWSAFRKFPRDMPAAEQAAIQERARSVIGGAVVPAYRRFDEFFRTEYLPATRTTVGIWDTPDGRAFYANRARYHTTTDLTPAQIHEIGLGEVARVHAEMITVMQSTGFKGDLPEFFKYLRTDPKFYFGDPEQLRREYEVTVVRIQPELVKLFGHLYRTPLGVRVIPATSAPNTTTAYYSPGAMDGTRAGYFYVNLYQPSVRPTYEIEVLTSHEAVPGHHLQIALAQERSDLPKFRRAAGYTAFVEGWGLYSERLGYELGLYQDPYSHFGQLTYDMWRAVRLVVDTGMHDQRWTRQQAIDYFKSNAAKTDTDIVNEIDRYIGWPGQALAYKIGQLKILELRKNAEQALGARFDVRAFHDELLSEGALPLDVLEKRMTAWVQAQRGKGR